MCRDGMAIPMSTGGPEHEGHSGITTMTVHIRQRGTDKYDDLLSIDRTFILPQHSSPDSLHQLMQQVERMVKTVDIHTVKDYGRDRYPEILYGGWGPFWSHAFMDEASRAQGNMANEGHMYGGDLPQAAQADDIIIVIHADGVVEVSNTRDSA